MDRKIYIGVWYIVITAPLYVKTIRAHTDFQEKDRISLQIGVLGHCGFQVFLPVFSTHEMAQLAHQIYRKAVFVGVRCQVSVIRRPSR